MPQIRKNTLQDAKSYGIIVWLITAQEKCSGIEVVITGLTRNAPRLRLSRPPVSLCFQGFSRVLKTKYFVVLTRRSNILVFPLF